MVKQKYAKEEHLHPVITIFIILVIGLLFFQGISLNRKIKSMREEINSMPHYECHNETKTEKIELEPYCLGEEDCWFGHEEYIGSKPFIDYEREIICDEGVSIYEFVGRLTNLENETKICFIRTIGEVCEIV